MAVAPSSDGSHPQSAHLPTGAPSRRGRGGAVRIDRAFWSHQDSMAHCRLPIENLSRVGYERGHTRDRAPGTERLQRADDSCPAGRPLACLSRRCLIFSARPRTDTRSRRTEPRRGCRWSPLPCLSVALYQKEAGIIGSLVPLPSTQRHLTPPNTAKHSLAVDAGLAATSTIHMDCLAPRCCAALLASPCRVPLSDAERRSGSGGTSPLECPSGQTLAPGPHGWLRWPSGLLAHAFPAMLVWKPFHSLILDLFFCNTSLCNHSAASPS